MVEYGTRNDYPAHVHQQKRGRTRHLVCLMGRPGPYSVGFVKKGKGAQGAPVFDARPAYLFLVVYGGTLNLLTLGIGSTRDHRTALAVSGEDNRTGSCDLFSLFHLKT